MREPPNDRLYDLLPMIYRQRDAAQGYPLRALLNVIAEQVDALEDDIGQLYENWFIETCEVWVVPYIGVLVGYRAVHEAGEPGDPRLPEAAARNKILTPRRDVANTIAARRRKGTLALLETLANDVANWPARAVEFYTLLGWTQHVNHVRWNPTIYPGRPSRGGTTDVRRGNALALIGGPFDETAHTVDVRRIASQHTPGRFNIPDIGLFAWRLQPYSVTQTPAYCAEQVGPQCYFFNVLGANTPLFNRPQPETEPTHIAEELNLPTPIRRRAFEKRVRDADGNWHVRASDDYYGEGKSITIWAEDWPKRNAPQPISPEHIVPADLSEWHYRPHRNFVAVDPETGRIAFPTGQSPRRGVKVSYSYAFSANIGGGEYDRTLTHPDHAYVYYVNQETGLKTAGTGATDDNIGKTFRSIGEAWNAWAHDRDRNKPDPPAVVIEIADSKVYTEVIDVALLTNETFQLRAANGARPILRFLDYTTDRPDPFRIAGQAGSRFTLDGLLIAGRGLLISDLESSADDEEPPSEDLCEVRIRHCTLVPGWSLEHDCEPRHPNEPSIEIIRSHARLRISDSILGTILVSANETREEPIEIEIADSILDATSADRVAIGSPDLPLAYANLNAARCTVFGQVQTHAIVLAENTIFTGEVLVGRRQTGCMRFCYAPPGSRTPRRYHCQPDLVTADLADEAAKEVERKRVRPLFTSERYSTPGYAQLRLDCAVEIRQGADDESELGAFHDLFQPQRIANLSARLDEFTPEEMQAGILFAN